jgi:undecaprenyl pyrophosphate phosphatase UppP
MITIACLVPIIASAQGFVPISNGGGSAGDNFSKLFKISGSTNDLSGFITNAFRAVLSLGAILAVIRIGWAGYQYMISDVGETKSHAKEILGDVVIGLLLLLSIYLILNQINPDILNLRPLKLIAP